MMEAIGHLVVHSDGVAEDGSWRGLWTIHMTNRDTPGDFQYVTDGNTEGVYSDHVEAQKSAHAAGTAKARELYNAA